MLFENLYYWFLFVINGGLVVATCKYIAFLGMVE